MTVECPECGRLTEESAPDTERYDECIRTVSVNTCPGCGCTFRMHRCYDLAKSLDEAEVLSRPYSTYWSSVDCRGRPVIALYEDGQGTVSAAVGAGDGTASLLVGYDVTAGVPYGGAEAGYDEAGLSARTASMSKVLFSPDAWNSVFRSPKRRRGRGAWRSA